MPRRTIRERFLSWALRGMVVEIDPSRLDDLAREVASFEATANGNIDAYNQSLDRTEESFRIQDGKLEALRDQATLALRDLAAEVGAISGRVDFLRDQVAANYREQAERLAVVESRAEADRAKLDALDDYARSLPTEDEVIGHIESSEYCSESNLAARFRSLAREVEAVRDTKITEDDLRSGRALPGEGITLADLGLDAEPDETEAAMDALDAPADEGEGATGEFPAACPGVAPADGPRCDDCCCGRPD